MKKMLRLFAILAITLLAANCNGGNGGETKTPVITVSQESFSFTATGSTVKITVTSDSEWGISSSQTWCKVSPSGGLKNSTTTVSVTADENSSYDARTAELVLKSGTYRKTLSVTQEAAQIESDIVVPDGYKLVWNDEFNEGASTGKHSLPSTANWWYETGDNGWGNAELENYIPGVSGKDTCALVSKGTLKIYAKKPGSQVLSIRMNTNESWTYGWFEAKLKLPVGKGTWPAFWMMPKNFTAWPKDGEIDIMEEVGYDPNRVSSSIHCMAYYHSIGTQKTANRYLAGAQTEFHVYALEWTKDYIKTYVDGVALFQFNNDGTGNYDTWPFSNPFYLKLNLAWGGGWGGAQGVDESCLPATYEVDYVRVFQKK